MASARDLAGTVDPAYAADPVGFMGDGGTDEFDPWAGDAGVAPPPGIDERAFRQTDRTILATRRAVFPLHGLDPEDPRD